MAGRTRNVGRLPPRYSFLLNPYSDARLSKCPKCGRPTHPRKFALMILIAGWGPMALGKTCRYCTPCELIIAHKDELEDELARSFDRINPEIIGNEYHVFGTIDKKLWKASLGKGGQSFDEALEHAADFKQVFDLKVEGGWRSA